MEIISTNANNTSQVEALVEQGRCLPLGSLVGLFFAHKDLNLTRQQAANGS